MSLTIVNLVSLAPPFLLTALTPSEDATIYLPRLDIYGSRAAKRLDIFGSAASTRLDVYGSDAAKRLDIFGGDGSEN